ncbi:helix-turn-helix domain-containing protein [Nocardia noduli]|uniref:helix-turn-helix domain-containing protein n=1 Tax=Nocardia noduli TaxID=2815722 RepID=UPI001C24D89A|nr:helix-turn-helix transcriptional regulator [Nocardia noduli]
MNGGVEAARAGFGARLREIRTAARLSGVALAAAAGWQSSKISRIEHGRQLPSEADLVTWCEICVPDTAALLLPDLRAALANVEALWTEWRRLASAGHAQQQRRRIDTEARTRCIRNYEPALIPGLLQTEPYARALLSTAIAFVGGHSDLDRAVAARMDRQQILRQGTRRIVILLGEQALYTTVGSPDVMAAQLRHLLDTGFDNARLHLAIIPRQADFVYTTTCFVLLDNDTAEVETISAGLTITAPRELVYYEKAWSALYRQAASGRAARDLITAALDGLSGG